MAELSDEDRRSAVWKRIEKILTERLQAHRLSNDGKLSIDETSRLRGRIAEVKAILALGTTASALEPVEHHPI